MIKIAICDDEPKDAELLFNLCKKCNLPYEITVFSAASDLLCAFSSDFYDLVFLDIEMPDPNGYEVGSRLIRTDPKPLIIFTTNSSQYAIQGYGIAFRYLCKPITLKMLQQVFKEASPYLLPQKILLTGDNGQRSVFINDILYYESLAHYLIFHLSDQTTVKTKDSLSHMLQSMQHPNFLQVHRSFCINLDYIDSMRPSFVILTDGTKIPVSREKRELLQQQFTLRIRGNDV